MTEWLSSNARTLIRGLVVAQQAPTVETADDLVEGFAITRAASDSSAVECKFQ